MKIRTGCKACDLAAEAARKRGVTKARIRVRSVTAVKVRVVCTEGHAITVVVHPRAAVNV